MDVQKFLNWLGHYPVDDAKQRKEILKEIKAWNIHSNKQTAREVCDHTDDFLESCEYFSSNTALFLTNLIEEVNGFRDVFAPFIQRIIHLVSKTLQAYKLAHERDTLHKTMRLVLQILQSYKDFPIWHENIESNRYLQDDLRLISFKVLEQLTSNEKNVHELSQMCGTIFGYMLSQIKEYSRVNETIAVLLFKCSHPFDIKVLPGVTLEMSCLKMTALSEKWLLLGVLSCCKSELLWSAVDGFKSNLWEMVFDRIVLSCKSHDHILQYHAFRALKLWWSRSKQLASKIDATHSLLQASSPIIEQSVSIVWRNWDNQVHGIPDLCMKIFELVLQANKIADNSTMLVDSASNHLSSTSPFVKGKYAILSVLIKFVGVEKFLSVNPDFLNALIPCLGKNHLAPVASRVYLCCIQGLRIVKQFSLEQWKKLLAPSLVAALLHNSPMVRKNALHHWVLPNLKTHQSVFNEVLIMLAHGSAQSISPKASQAATLGIMKCARCNGVKQFPQLDLVVMNSCITAFDNSIRSDAWSIVCISHRPSDSITNEEFDLVMQHLPLNFNSDSASFRNELLFCVRLFVQRVMTTLSSCLKKNTLDQYVSRCVHFLAWLFNLCKESLAPSCSFQRKQTALSVFTCLLQVKDFSENSKKASILPQDIKRINEELCNKGLHFDTAIEAKLLIQLLKDVVPEIREEAVKLALQYFPKSLLSQFSVDLQKTCQALLKSPKAQDAESGALMSDFLFNIDLLPSGTQSLEKEEVVCAFERCLQATLPHLNNHLKQLQTNYLDASYNAPGFGWLLALSKCCDAFSTVASIGMQNSPWEDCMNDLNLAVESIVKAMTYVMVKVFACVNDKMDFVASADFREMSARIVAIIEQCRNTTDCDQDTLISTDHDVVLACSWLIMRNGCQVLTSIALLLIKFSHAEDMVKFQFILASIMKMFLSILTSCRHRGVIESCAESLNLLCRSLFRSKLPHLNDFAVGILDDILLLFADVNSKSNVSGATVTRRSAGMPLIVESVLSASVGTSFSNDLVEKTVTSMSACISKLSDNTLHKLKSNTDIPAVHALYVLKHIFKNTSLGSMTLSYSTSVFKLSLECLYSDLWLVRNAAMHLLGAVSSRMLGQKHIETTDHTSATNSLTLHEFFNWYPELLHVMVGCLTENKSIAKEQLLSPTVHPVISVLSKLSNTEDTSADGELGMLLHSLQYHLACPSFSVRRSCAQAILGLKCLKNIVVDVSGFLKNLPSDDSMKGSCYEPVSQNALHGWLELVYQTFQRYKEDQGHNQFLLKIWKLLKTRQWIGKLCFNKCSLTAALYVQIFNLALGIFPNCNGGEQFTKFLLQMLVASANNFSAQVDFFTYQKYAIELILNVSNTEELPLLLDSLFETKKTIINVTVLKWIQVKLKSKQCFLSPKILQKLLAHSSIVAVDNFDTCCDIWANIYSIASYETYINFSSIVQQTTKTVCKLSTSCQIILALTFLVKYDLNGKDFSEMCHLKQWISVVAKHTYNNHSSEPLRLASASGLSIAGPNILQWIYATAKDPNINEKNVLEYLFMSSSIYKTALWHLHDEQLDVREKACEFVANLNASELVPHPNVATQVLLKNMTQHPSHFSMLGMLLDFIIDLSILPEDSRSGLNLFEQEAFNLYVEPCQVAAIMSPAIKELMSKCGDIPRQWWQTYFNVGTLRLKQVVDCVELSENRLWHDSAICTLVFLKHVVEIAEKHCLPYQKEHIKKHVCLLQKVEDARLLDQIHSFKEVAETT